MNNKVINRKLLLFILILAFSQTLHSTILYVNANVQGGNQNGTSWADAYPLLQSAIIAAQYGDTIWVAQGTYLPTTSINRNISFTLKNGVRMFGGFTGTESALSERDWELNETVLSGDIGVPDDSTDNSYTVVYSNFADSTTVLDGFVITGGSADSQVVFEPSNGRTKSGGGMYLENSSQGEDAQPVIFNCKFIRNNASYNGGGIYMKSTSNGAVTPLLVGSIFEENYASNGAGVHKSGSSMNHDMFITDCSFVKNDASGTGQGGGFSYISNYGSQNLIFRGCHFESNSAIASGGGIFHERNNELSQIVVKKCHFENNFLPNSGEGGAICNYNFWLPSTFGLTIDSCNFSSNYQTATLSYGDSVQVSNSIFSYNSGCIAIGNWGGALTVDSCDFKYNLNTCVSSSLDAMVTNSEFIFNTASSGACFSTSGSLKVKNCYFEGNTATSLGWNGSVPNGGGVFYTGVIAPKEVEFANSRFVSNSALMHGGCFVFGGEVLKVNNCSFENNSAGERGGVFSSGSKSTIVSNCLFEGNSADKRGGVFYFFSNDTTRLLNCSFMKNESPLGGLLYNYYSFLLKSNILFSNSIIWENNLGSDTNQIILNLADSIGVTFSHSLIDVPDCASIANPSNIITCGPGMLYMQDPLFADTAAGDFTLLPCSPAIDAGDNAIVDSLGITTDLAGNPRIQGGTVDMGAYESPAFNVDTFLITQPSCGGAEGAVQFQLAHGCSPFSYDWTSGTNSGTGATGLSPGEYSFTFTDALGKTVEAQVEIPEVPAMTASATAQPYDCTNTTGGSASITPTGGTGPFEYLWDNGSMESTLADLSPGTYAVTVTDANGCSLADSVTVETTGHLTLSINVTPTQCSDTNDGTAAVTPLGGTAPFAWLWQDDQTDSLLTGLGGGSWSVTVTDALGCTGDVQFSMTAPDTLVAEATGTDAPCFGEATGEAAATATGGTGAYEYDWSNAMTTPTINQLPPGWYYVTVTDVNQCSDTASVFIASPPALDVAVEAPPTLCFGSADGTAEALVSGGTTPYSFEWETGQTDSLLTGLPPGAYSVTVTDGNECTEQATAVIDSSTQIQALFEITHATGASNADGGVEVSLVFGGTPGYEFLWSNGAVTQSLENVLPGPYTLTVTDADSCQNVFYFTVQVEVAAGEEQAVPFRAVIVPNPSGVAGAEVWLELTQPQMLTVQVLDGLGRVLFTKKAFATAGETRWNLPQGLPPGVYWVVVKNGGGAVRVLKWVVM
jgi:SprB repeat